MLTVCGNSLPVRSTARVYKHNTSLSASHIIAHTNIYNSLIVFVVVVNSFVRGGTQTGS